MSLEARSVGGLWQKIPETLPTGRSLLTILSVRKYTHNLFSNVWKAALLITIPPPLSSNVWAIIPNNFFLNSCKRGFQAYLHTSAHGSPIYNRQNLETSQRSKTREWPRSWPSSEQKGKLTLCNSMDRPGEGPCYLTKSESEGGSSDRASLICQIERSKEREAKQPSHTEEQN